MKVYIATYKSNGCIATDPKIIDADMTIEELTDFVEVTNLTENYNNDTKTIVWEEDELIAGKVPDRVPCFTPLRFIKDGKQV